MVALADADAGDLATVALGRTGLLLLPVEHGRTLVQGLLDEGRRERTAVGPDLAVGFRSIDLADRNAVDAEVACRLVHDRFDRGDKLVLARPALWAGRRRVGQHR